MLKQGTIAVKIENAESQTCTGDAGLFRPALYYLSYLGRKIKYALFYQRLLLCQYANIFISGKFSTVKTGQRPSNL